MDSGITVIGYGQATAPADLLRISIGVGCDADDVADAVDAAGGRTKAVLKALQEAGVDPADVHTSSVQIYPNFGPDPVHSQGYRASHHLEVTSRDLDAFGRILNAAVDAAGNDLTVDQLGFDVEDKTALLVQARQAAFDDARERAAHLAGLSGRELGVLEAVEETPHHGPIVPRQAKTSLAPMPAELGVEPGRQTVDVALNVRWSLA